MKCQGIKNIADQEDVNGMKNKIWKKKMRKTVDQEDVSGNKKIQNQMKNQNRTKTKNQMRKKNQNQMKTMTKNQMRKMKLKLN